MYIIVKKAEWKKVLSLFKTEKKLMEYFIKNINIFVFVLFTFIAVVLRFYGRNFVTNDMKNFLLPWFDAIKKNGGLSALSSQVGNYGILYQTIIALMTYFKINPMYMYKTLSIIFDFALAFYAAKLACYIRKEKPLSYTFNIVYGLALCIPVFIYNSSFWGQCDSIYCFFIIYSIYQLLNEKYISSFVLLGIAFAFKLQTVFILPFFILEYLKEKKFTILMFFVPVAILLISGIPAVIYGRSVLEPFIIYISQTVDMPMTCIDYNSFWNINDGPFETIKWICISVAVIGDGIVMLSILSNRLKYKLENKIYFASLLVWTTLIFLPSMHERYDYLLLILLLIQIAINIKYIFSTIIAFCLSHMTYAYYLFDFTPGYPTIYSASLAILAYVLYVKEGYKEYYQRRFSNE